MKQAPPAALVVFGASGDLAARKLVPALYELHRSGLLPDAFSVVGTARTPMSHTDFQARVLEASTSTDDAWREVVARFRYVPGEYHEASTYTALGRVLDELDAQHGTGGNRLFYLATLPSLFGTIAECLGQAGLNKPTGEGSFARLVVEKPYGRDLASARALDETVHHAFDESSVYRIDHYLGKETVQNVLALRFANAIFEPIWNRRYIDNVQITVAETLGVGHRAGFYETAGALRDIVQNHVLQVLALTAMEPPAQIRPEEIRDEKVKVLKAITAPTGDTVALTTVRGQYKGYCDEPDVAKDSSTETFVALRLMVDNWRWNGVPFYLRTGKKLTERATEIALEFREIPHLPFMPMNASELGPNVLVVRVQPDEGITLRFGAKVPGPDFTVRSVNMDFTYAEEFKDPPPEADERLLFDALVGDPTLFIRADEVREAWRICDPILEAWAEGGLPVEAYEPGTWGPASADRLPGQDANSWHTPTCG
jgi:glucose-6-phosphate 1-dehydrogenase